MGLTRIAGCAILSLDTDRHVLHNLKGERNLKGKTLGKKYLVAILMPDGKSVDWEWMEEQDITEALATMPEIFHMVIWKLRLSDENSVLNPHFEVVDWDATQRVLSP